MRILPVKCFLYYTDNERLIEVILHILHFICQPFLINSLHSSRAEVSSSSNQSTNYSGKHSLCVFEASPFNCMI